MKKTLTLVLVLALCLMGMSVSFAATDVTWNVNNPKLPLAETVTFNIMSEAYGYMPDFTRVDELQDLQSLEAAANVKIEWTYIQDGREAYEARFLNGDYGDAIWTYGADSLNAADVGAQGEAGIFIDLAPYITPEIMPNFCKYVSPDQVRYMKDADGHVYALCPVDQRSPYTAIEGLTFVNVAWMEQWQQATGYEGSPKTLDDFENMLRYFKDNDMNGNGDPSDEIPYVLCEASYGGCSMFEHAMAPWGIATKDSGMDMNAIITEDQQIVFAHTLDAYKEALKVFQRWFADGLIWKDAFIADSDYLWNVAGSESKEKWGVYNAAYPNDGFEVIVPFDVEGYDTTVFMHPACRSGVAVSQFIITDKCKDPEALLAFIDLQYDPVNGVLGRYGTTAFDPDGYAAQHSDVCVTCYFGDDGKICFNTVENEDRVMDYANMPVGSALVWLTGWSSDAIEEFFDEATFVPNTSAARGYILCREAGVLNPTDRIYPRPLILAEDQEDKSFLQNEIQAITKEYRAKFITGEYDIDAQWDEFQQKLEKAGIEEFRDILQRAYDSFLAR